MFGVIGLLGRKRSGKSTVAKYLMQTYGAEIVSFAKALKLMCAVFIHELEKLWNTGNARVMVRHPTEPSTYAPFADSMLSDPEWKEGMLCVVLSSMSGDVVYSVTELFTLRWLQMIVGTEMVRNNLGQNTWARAVHEYMTARSADGKQHLFVIDDVRFPNEVEMIRSLHGGVVIKLTCSDDPIPTGEVHASENIDAIPLEHIDEAVVSYRSEGSEHLIGAFKDALERLAVESIAVETDERSIRSKWLFNAINKQRGI